MDHLDIDGSTGEGGGQLSRYALALAAITGRSISLRNIRATRSKPGLRAQHLTALQAVAKVSGGVLEGAALGATEIRFRPGEVRGGAYHFDVGTAGAVTLVLQALLPVVLHADGPCELSLVGGTDVTMAPPVDYLRLVFLPWLARLGVEVRLESVRRGYYPRGGGAVRLTVTPNRQPRPLEAETGGALKAIRGVAHVGHLPPQVAQRMATAARGRLLGLGPVELDVQTLSDADARGSGGAVVVVAETEHGLLGAATVAEQGVAAERLGESVGRSLREELESGAGVDVHAVDQILLYAAQARGPSVLSVREVSLHTQTVLWLLPQFLPVRFELEPLVGRTRIRVLTH